MSYLPFRVEISGELSILTPLHIGTGESVNPLTDAPVLRVDGKPFIPGSSLRGVLRRCLRGEASLLGCTSDHWLNVFGDTVGRTRLTIRSAFSSEVALPAEIRDHVRLDRFSGAASQAGKFDNEVILPGAGLFSFHATYDGEGPDDRELVLVAHALRLLAEGAIQVGAKTGWGYGQIRLEGCRSRAFDRSQPGPLAQWLLARYQRTPLSAGSSFSFPDPGTPVPADGCLVEPWGKLALDFDIQFDGPVLIKYAFPPGDGYTGVESDPATYAQAGLAMADHVPLTCAVESGQHYLPGSSLRGILHSRADWLAASGFVLTASETQTLFGSATGDEGRRGLIRIFDGRTVNDPPFVFIDHVALDRITNATASEKKFSNQALQSPLFSVRMEVLFLRVNTGELLLLGHLLRDLRDRLLWAGSNTTRGYGHIHQVHLTAAKASIPEPWNWRLPDNTVHNRGREDVSISDWSGLFQWIESLSAQEGFPV